jgi:hypothetical protein
MRRILALLFVPLWLGFALLAGAWVHSEPALRKAHAGSKPAKETTLNKVEAAPVVGLQMQVPAADWCGAAQSTYTWPELTAYQGKQPLKANGATKVSGFGHRYFEHAIALRAP